MLRLTLAASLLVSSCVTKVEKSEKKEPPHSQNHYVVADMNKRHVDKKPTAIGAGLYKSLLRKNMGEEAKGAARTAKMFGQGFVSPIDDYMNLFLKEDANFHCKETKSVLYCDVTSKTGMHLIKMRLIGKDHVLMDFMGGRTSGDYAMHFCNAGSQVMIDNTNQEFWEVVNELASSSKEEIYQTRNSAPLNGAILVLKSSGNGITVTDFRASIGNVVPNSEEYKEFVDSNCLTYVPSEKHEM